MTTLKRKNGLSLRMILISLAAVLLLVGCASREEENAAVDLDPAEVAGSILDGVDFKDSLVAAEAGAAEMYYKLDDTITGYAIYVSGSGATAEEIAVLKTTDTAAARAIVEARIESLKFQFEDYVPAEMVKLDDPVIVTRGDIVVLVLADDAPAAKKLVEGLFG